MDECSRALLAETSLEAPHRALREPEQIRCLGQLTSPAITLVSTHVRCCSALVIVIVSLMPGD